MNHHQFAALGSGRGGNCIDRNRDVMKIPSREFVRTTLFTSSAGMLLGVPLLGGLPLYLHAEEPAAAAVVRGQSSDDGGAISRWWGRRGDGSVQGEVSAATGPEMNDALAQAPAQNPGMFGRLLGSSDPDSPQAQRQLTRAQQKYFRRNPQMYQMYMMQQQMLMLQQQQELQQQYEAEAVPERESFDSLDINPQEWADAPGRQITEDLSTHAGSKPWWETGETPVNSRPRRAVEEDSNPVSDTPSVVPQTTLPAQTAVSEIPDLFPANGAAAVAGPATTPAQAPTLAPAQAPAPVVPSNATPAIAPPVPVARQAPADSDFGLVFPTETSPAASAPATSPQPSSPSAASTASVATPSAAPSTVDFVPPEPMSAATGVNSTILNPPAVPAPLVVAPVPVEAPSAIPTDDAFLSPAPVVNSDLPPVSPPSFPTEPASTQPELGVVPPTESPDVAAPFIPEMPAPAPATTAPAVAANAEAAPVAPVTEAVPSAAAPLTTTVELPSSESSPAASPNVEPAPADGGSPFTGLKLDNAPWTASPPAAATPEPSIAPPVEPVSPFPPSEPVAAPPATAMEEPGPGFVPEAPTSDEPSAEYQFPPERTVAVPNPAPFIPPEPESFGGELPSRLPPLMAPSLSSDSDLAPPAIAGSKPALLSPADEYLAPDVEGWTPETLPAPDPIVAPSTARKLVVTPPPTPRDTDSKIERISARRGLSGFKGFCPVALKDHRELQDARPEYSAVHNGRRYFFSSATAQELFESNPDDYVPAAMGNDVVHLMLTGASAAGSLEHAVWFRSRLYLFTSAETMETFVAAPSIHARDE